MIGSIHCTGESINAHKRSYREARLPVYRVEHAPEDLIKYSIKDLEDVHLPHNDALVIAISIGSNTVGRVLVDPGSSINILYLSAFKSMKLRESDLSSNSQDLVGFNGTVTRSSGTIKLPVRVEGANPMTLFHVLDARSGYNALLGRPWIHDMRAHPSTLHQKLKYPTEKGIRVIKGDQQVSRSCLVEIVKLKAHS